MKPLFLILVCLSAASSQPARHAFTADDWAALRSSSPVAVSPDGASILYKVSFGGEKGPSNTEWRLIRADGSDSRKLELPEHFTPSGFTRDGSALFGSFEVNKRPQLAVFPLASLKPNLTPSMLVLLPAGIRSALVSPDGERFAILADPRLPDALAETRTVVEPDQTSIYVVNADGTGGKWWCPSLTSIADNGLSGTPIAWSPDGASLAVLSQTPKIGFHDIHSYLDICTASGARRVASIDNAAAGIAWTGSGPDRDLAFLSSTTDVLTPDHLWTVPAAGGKPADRTAKLQGSVTGLAADPRGKLWVLVQRGVQNEVAAFQDGALTPAFRWPAGIVTGPPFFSPYTKSSDQLVFAVGDPAHTGNLAVPSANALKKITTDADAELAKVDLGEVRIVHWTSKEGIAIEGIATFPAGYTPGRRYPFLVLPHGGPESNDQFSLDVFSRNVAGLGYVVLQPEYRGSTGYGSEFLQSIYQHFGDRAYRDVDSATDYAIAQGWADPNRLASFGWSAGGFMTSWTVTQTGRYKAAIEGAGITDWASFLWTSDVQQFDYDARWPAKDPAAFTRFSAVNFADRVTTPLLVLHGEADARVPTFQGREFFEVLAALGKTTRMVTYPGSPHFPRLWEQRRDVFREIAAWLARYNP
jgi:dipeptidyl aminopeptidase/acylaminoacyl peptidase